MSDCPDFPGKYLGCPQCDDITKWKSAERMQDKYAWLAECECGAMVEAAACPTLDWSQDVIVVQGEDRRP